MAGTSAGAKKGWLSRKGGGIPTPTTVKGRIRMAKDLRFVRGLVPRTTTFKKRNRAVVRQYKALNRGMKAVNPWVNIPRGR